VAGTPTAHLHVEGSTPLHRLPAHAKLVGLLLLVLAAVGIPAGEWGLLALALLVAVGLLLSTRIPVRLLAPRLAVETPFVIFALVLPFIATGPRTRVGPVLVSEPGLVAAGTLLAKATVGVVCGVAFASTTQPRDLVRALHALRVPNPLVQILSFMVRYLSVVGQELSRMRVARESRGFHARGVRAWPALASSAGALFLRSYERGERVHLAMLSRGYSGRLPDVQPLHATPTWWLLALVPAATLALALAVTR
jgi:cobalt/nickel transport system permease protein